MKGKDARRAIRNLHIEQGVEEHRCKHIIEKIEERIKAIQGQCEHRLGRRWRSRTRRNSLNHLHGECLDCGVVIRNKKEEQASIRETIKALVEIQR